MTDLQPLSKVRSNTDNTVHILVKFSAKKSEAICGFRGLCHHNLDQEFCAWTPLNNFHCPHHVVQNVQILAMSLAYEQCQVAKFVLCVGKCTAGKCAAMQQIPQQVKN